MGENDLQPGRAKFVKITAGVVATAVAAVFIGVTQFESYTDWKKIATPAANPAAGRVFTYVKADGLIYTKDESGAETSAGGGPPSGAAGGDLTGTYPNPTVALLAITDAKVATANKDGTAGTPSMRTLGTGALQATAGNDARLSDSRAPTGAAGGDLTGSTYPNPEIAAGSIVNADINATAGIVDTKLAQIATAGKVADTALSSNVPLKNTANTYTFQQQNFLNAPVSFTHDVGDGDVKKVEVTTNGDIILANHVKLKWSSTADADNVADTVIRRDSAGIIQFSNNAGGRAGILVSTIDANGVITGDGSGLTNLDADVLTNTTDVDNGGTNLTSGTSGGILGFTGATTIASSVALTANALVLGGGVGATPTPMASLGTTTTVLHGNPAGAPTFGAVSLTADVSNILPGANGGTNNGFMQFTGPATSLKTYTIPNADTNLSPMTTAGDLVTHNGTDNIRLAKGTAFQRLRVNSGATALEYATLICSQSFFVEADSSGPSDSIYSTGVNEIKYFALSDGSDQGVLFAGQLPSNISLDSDPKLIFQFFPTVAVTAGNARFTVTYISVSNDSLVDIAAEDTDTQDIAVSATAGTLSTVTVTIDRTVLAANDMIRFRIRRIGTDVVNDTYTGLIGIIKEVRLTFVGE